MRANSQSLVSPFAGGNFLNTFDRSSPSYGNNDTGASKVPTKLKLRNSSNSAIISNSAALASAQFPNTTHITTGAAFNPQNVFGSADMKGNLVRITLVDAIPLDPTKDAPPLAAPETDYSPVYRVDSLTSSDRGAHLFGYVTGNLYYIDTVGFYGKDFVQVNQDCTSATFQGANPGPTNAKCPVASMGSITIANNAEIYGSGRANGSIVPLTRVCGDYPSCQTRGRNCQGTSCNVPDLPVFRSWNEYCPTSNGDYTVAANQNRILVTAGCYNNVTINNKGSITLQTTGTPYFFKNLNISGGNPLTQIRIAPSPATGTVELYVETIVTDNLNGNQAINPSYRPSQFRIYYLGSNNLMLNGNAEMKFAMVAPYAQVTLSGNSTFSGGIVAKSLILNGSATVRYDETLGGATLNDLTFRLRNIEQAYN